MWVDRLITVSGMIERWRRLSPEWARWNSSPGFWWEAAKAKLDSVERQVGGYKMGRVVPEIGALRLACPGQ
jgi:hypothetical protein